MRNIQSLSCWDTEYSADSIEWCPDQEYHDYFVCGTYKLEQNAPTLVENSSPESSQQRVGRIYLFQYQNTEPYLLKRQAIEMPAVLDCKWCPVRINGLVLLAVANAKGNICIYQLSICDSSLNEELKLSILIEKQVPNSTEENVLSLSVDWSPRLNSVSCDQVNLAVSDSKGCISIFTIVDNALILLHNWKSHDYEAWIVSFNHWNDSILYTGGDDCRLCVYDTRCGTDHPISVSRLHTAGVTSMNYSSFNENKFISGSYDENILLWDTRQMKRNIGSINVGGGVWRLKWEPNKEKYILAACMYNGFRIIDCVDETNLEIAAEFNEHESIAYGADWSHLSSEYLRDNLCYNNMSYNDIIDLKLISTCSFYDHKLFVSFFK